MIRSSLVLVLVVGSLGCTDRPWADVPAGADGEGECPTTPPPPLTPCDQAERFDDLVVFAVDRVELVESPVYLDGVVIDGDGCGTVDNGLRAHGTIEAAAKGTATTSLIFPGGSHLFDVATLTGRRLLAPVVVRGDEVFVSTHPPRVETDVVGTATVVDIGDSDCRANTIEGMTVDALLDAVTTCTTGGALSDEDRARPYDGAACFGPTAEVCSGLDEAACAAHPSCIPAAGVRAEDWCANTPNPPYFFTQCALRDDSCGEAVVCVETDDGQIVRNNTCGTRGLRECDDWCGL